MLITDMNQKTMKVLAVFFILVLTCAFEWPWGAGKQTKKPTQTAGKAASSESAKEKTESVAPKETNPADPASEAENPQVKAAPASGIPSSIDPNVELNRIQAEVTAITVQTKVLAAQGVADRTRLQQIVEQANMHKRLLASLKVPQSVVTKQTVNTDQIVRDAKVRLIADEVKKIHTNLQAIQKPAKVVKAPVTPRKTST